MTDAIKDVTGVDAAQLKTFEEAKEAARKLGVDISQVDSRGGVINAIFEAKVEHTLMQPTFIIDYPVEISPLTKQHRTNEGEVERFEFFIYGRELANGYSELNDPQDQRARLEDQAKKKAAGNDEAMPLDLRFHSRDGVWYAAHDGYRNWHRSPGHATYRLTVNTGRYCVSDDETAPTRRREIGKNSSDMENYERMFE